MSESRLEWPADWAERKSAKDCSLCARQENPFWVHVATGTWSAVYLDSRSCMPGCCVVVWAQGHAVEPADLSDADATGYWREVLDVGRAIGSVFEPLKINYMILGVSTPHLHTIVVPRHRQDPAPGMPIPWNVLFSSPSADGAVVRRHADNLRRSLSWVSGGTTAR
jgi:diadenosine tetraphosphate (Ap4A) HIT family hydrolase